VTALVLAAAWPTLLLASLSTAVFYGSRGWVAELLDSPGVATGIAWATPGLFFFAVNKVLLAVTNGVSRMRAFAVFNALRYVLILAGLLVAMALELDSDALAFVFTFSEGLLFLGLAVEVALQLGRGAAAGWVRWSFEHLRYGLKSAASGMLLELNSRVDVLMVGYFLDDARVGIYSYAAILAEGVIHPLVVLQNNYNPLLAQHVAAGRKAELRSMTRSGKRTTYLLMGAVCALAFLRLNFTSIFFDRAHHIHWIRRWLWFASDFVRDQLRSKTMVAGALQHLRGGSGAAIGQRKRGGAAHMRRDQCDLRIILAVAPSQTPHFHRARVGFDVEQPAAALTDIRQRVVPDRIIIHKRAGSRMNTCGGRFNAFTSAQVVRLHGHDLVEGMNTLFAVMVARILAQTGQ